MVKPSPLQTVKKVRRPQKQHNAKKETVNFRFFLFELLKHGWSLGANAFAFCVVRLLPYPQTKRFGHRRFFGKTARRSALLPSARHAPACLGRGPRRSSVRFAENLQSETGRFFRLESRRTQPYGRMARDETNQTGKYSVSGTMLPESLCLSLQRRTPCPCSLSDSLRACQKQSFLTSSEAAP